MHRNDVQQRAHVAAPPSTHFYLFFQNCSPQVQCHCIGCVVHAQQARAAGGLQGETVPQEYLLRSAYMQSHRQQQQGGKAAQQVQGQQEAAQGVQEAPEQQGKQGRRKGRRAAATTAGSAADTPTTAAGEGAGGAAAEPATASTPGPSSAAAGAAAAAEAGRAVRPVGVADNGRGDGDEGDCGGGEGAQAEGARGRSLTVPCKKELGRRRYPSSSRHYEGSSLLLDARGKKGAAALHEKRLQLPGFEVEAGLRPWLPIRSASSFFTQHCGGGESRHWAEKVLVVGVVRREEAKVRVGLG